MQDSSNSNKATQGLTQLWADLCRVHGKASIASKLRPYLIRALAQPDSSVHRFIDAVPAVNYFLSTYKCQPAGLRHRMIKEALSDEVSRQALDIFQNGLANLGVMNRRLGITLAEAERQISRSFEHELCHIKLNELLSGLQESPRQIDVRVLLRNLRLTPGSIAGADKRLRGVLTQRMKTFSGNVPYYEQDLKAALWECSKNKELAHEIGDLVKKQGDLLAQTQLLLRMAQRQEPQLVRGVFLKVLRRMILALPDIHQEVKAAKQGDRIVPLTEEMLAILPGQQSENVGDDIHDLLTQRGIDIEHLNVEDLRLLAEELERLRLGRTRKEHYGQNEGRIKQQFRRLCDKLKSQTQ